VKQKVRTDIHLHEWGRRLYDQRSLWHRVVDTIPRESQADLSLDRFYSQYDSPGKPVVITNAMEDWPAMKNWQPEVCYLRIK
jgi:histone arginine demethylase JMJD6